jgi:hypothetical protein
MPLELSSVCVAGTFSLRVLRAFVVLVDGNDRDQGDLENA